MNVSQTPSKATTEAMAAQKAPTTRHCNCGCGEATSSSRTMYKPGHDARHAGMVARAMAAAKINGDKEYTPALADLPSPKLRAKAEAMAKRIVEQVSSKAQKAAARKSATKAPKDHKTPGAKQAEAFIDGFQAEVTKALAKATPGIVAAEEAAYAEESARIVPEPMFEDEDAPATVKIGRWEYPARNGGTERNTKRNGSGDWIPVS